MTTVVDVIILFAVIFNGVSCQCEGMVKPVQVGYTTISITPPGYPFPGYEPNLSCKWLIESSVGDSKILFRATNITLSCAGDALNVYDGTSDGGEHIHDNECNPSGTSRTLEYHVSAKGEVYTAFTSDKTKTEGEYGFLLYLISAMDFSGTGCNGEQEIVADSSLRYLSSPNFPNEYDKSMDCVWNIQSKEDSAKVMIQFEFLEIESDSSCQYDYLEIKEAGKTKAKLCEEEKNKVWIPAINYTTTGNRITIVFHSDDLVTRRGFLLSYRQIDIQTTTVEEPSVLSTTAMVPTTKKRTTEEKTRQTTTEPLNQSSTNGGSTKTAARCKRCTGLLSCLLQAQICAAVDVGIGIRHI